MSRVDDIRARLAAATAADEYPLPWQELGETREFWIEAGNGQVVLDTTAVYEPLTSFLENAPADLVWLLEDNARLRAALQELVTLRFARPADYEARKSLAWTAASEALREADDAQ